MDGGRPDAGGAANPRRAGDGVVSRITDSGGSVAIRSHRKGGVRVSGRWTAGSHCGRRGSWGSRWGGEASVVNGGRPVSLSAAGPGGLAVGRDVARKALSRAGGARRSGRVGCMVISISGAVPGLTKLTSVSSSGAVTGDTLVDPRAGSSIQARIGIGAGVNRN